MMAETPEAAVLMFTATLVVGWILVVVLRETLKDDE
jgi:hypothetical protein